MKNRLKKKEKWFWERFGIANKDLDKISPEVDWFNFRDSEINDEDMYWLSTRIKRIRKLDLDHTFVTDEGIRWLSKIDITELRLKGCAVTPVSIPYLNEMKNLELLHLRSTDITLDDLPELSALQELKLLLVNSDNGELAIRRKVNKLCDVFPHCEFIVNQRGYGRRNKKIV